MELAWFAGVDWGSQKHQACVLDAAGELLGEREFEHSGAGLSQMANWLLSFAAGDAGAVGLAIETPSGPVVESLMERGFAVHSINPKQLDRFRDRFSPAGAKDDRRDARDVTAATQVNAQVSKGFRLGGINDPLNTPICSPVDLATFGDRGTWEDEELWNYEAGVKSTLLGGRGTFNASGFYMDVRNLQATVTAGTCSQGSSRARVLRVQEPGKQVAIT